LVQEITDCNHPKQEICGTLVCGTCYEKEMETNKQKAPRSVLDPAEMLSVHAKERWNKAQKGGMNWVTFKQLEKARN
jgi:hypothetical protein